jgi:bifunctional ADP-heptose synthase (sugar kinase/adenylyltransferase)
LRLRSAGVGTDALWNRRAPSVTKHRFLVETQKIFKVDEGAAAPLDSKDEEELAELILSAADGAAAVVFADFGYGTITSGLLDRVMGPLRRRTEIITADVSGRQGNLLKFKGVDLLCPTEREVRETLHDFSNGLSAVVWNLLHATSARQAIITLGKQGLVTFDQPTEKAKEAMLGRLRSEYVPALCTHGVDPLGCGDALLAAASLTLAAGGSLQAAAFIGSIAAGFELRQIGNEPISAEALLARIHQAERRAAPRLAS